MRLEQLHKTKRKHAAEIDLSTFPETHAPQSHGGDGEPNIEELLARIEEVLRALGSSTGIEVA